MYVGDVARANLAALTAGDGDVFCIAYGEGTSVNTLYRSLADEIGHEVEIQHAPKRPGDIYLSYFNCTKARHQLGWNAQVHLQQGLRLTVNYSKQKLGVT